jgi:hypothetical protein
MRVDDKWMRWLITALIFSHTAFALTYLDLGHLNYGQDYNTVLEIAPTWLWAVAHLVTIALLASVVLRKLLPILIGSALSLVLFNITALSFIINEEKYHLDIVGFAMQVSLSILSLFVFDVAMRERLK